MCLYTKDIAVRHQAAIQTALGGRLQSEITVVATTPGEYIRTIPCTCSFNVVRRGTYHISISIDYRCSPAT